MVLLATICLYSNTITAKIMLTVRSFLYLKNTMTQPCFLLNFIKDVDLMPDPIFHDLYF